MPELHFRVRWPDARLQRCHSSSRSVTESLVAGGSYALEDFVAAAVPRSSERASERVRRRYGFARTSAAAQLEEIERAAGTFEPGGGAS